MCTFKLHFIELFVLILFRKVMLVIMKEVIVTGMMEVILLMMNGMYPLLVSQQMIRFIFPHHNVSLRIV